MKYPAYVIVAFMGLVKTDYPKDKYGKLHPIVTLHSNLKGKWLLAILEYGGD